MTKNEELINGLFTFNEGLEIILDCISNLEEEGQLMLDIFNDGEYAQDRYMNCFSMSFDEEVAELQQFISSLSKVDIHQFQRTKPETKNPYKNIIIGFNLATEGLERVVEVLKNDKELKKEIINFQPLDYDGNISDYNPFKKYGIAEFQKKFKGFRRAYLSELRQKLGDYQYRKLQD